MAPVKRISGEFFVAGGESLLAAPHSLNTKRARYSKQAHTTHRSPLTLIGCSERLCRARASPMPKRTDLKKILLIGSGPIVIGQACEFDYSGTQACKALREEGYTVVLVNSNPATIMTDPGMADRTYIEPVHW